MLSLIYAFVAGISILFPYSSIRIAEFLSNKKIQNIYFYIFFAAASLALFSVSTYKMVFCFERHSFFWLARHIVLQTFLCTILISFLTDMLEMSIYSLFTTYLVPAWIMASVAGLSQADGLVESFLGLTIGYGLPFVVAKVFMKLRGIEGLGSGDIELLGAVGSFVGPERIALIIALAAFSGALVGGGYMFLNGKGKSEQIPFAPFICFGVLVSMFIC